MPRIAPEERPGGDISLELFDALESVPVQGYDAGRRVIYWNHASERVYGYSRAEALGRRLEELIIPEPMRGEVVEAVRAWLEEGAPIPAGDLVLRHKDGSEVHVYSSHLMRTNARDEPELYCVDIDVTERRRAEDATRRALQQKEVLLKELQHRVKNNMQIVRSLAALQGRQEPHPAAARALEKIRDRVGVMSLVHDLTLGSEPVGKVELSEYLRRLTAQVHADPRGGGAGARFSLAAPAGLLLSVDQALPCGLALSELLANALAHAFPGRAGGVVEVAAAAEPGGRLVLAVRDHGVGLPPGMDWRESPGLGLDLVQGLVEEQLRGRVEVRSRPDQGTAVTLAFTVER
jgi:PAS domain S-box-containing protein